MSKSLRKESTPKGKALWEAVDRTAARCPKWIIENADLLEKTFGKEEIGKLDMLKWADLVTDQNLSVKIDKLKKERE